MRHHGSGVTVGIGVTVGVAVGVPVTVTAGVLVGVGVTVTVEVGTGVGATTDGSVTKYAGKDSGNTHGASTLCCAAFFTSLKGNRIMNNAMAATFRNERRVNIVYSSGTYVT